MINIILEDETIFYDVMAGHLGQEDGGIPADVPGGVLHTWGFIVLHGYSVAWL